MMLARENEALLIEEQAGLEEIRRRRAKEPEREQTTRDQQSKEKRERIKQELEAAQKEAAKKAEET